MRDVHEIADEVYRIATSVPAANVAFNQSSSTTRCHSCSTPVSGSCDRLEALAPRVLACMHGPAVTGDCVRALRDLRVALAEAG